MSRNFHHKPAVREATPLLVGLTGPSGSGKTKSALRLATGIVSVRGGKIAFIDTEANRGLHYAPAPGEQADRERGSYAFEHIPFAPPHGSEDYAEAIAFAAELAAGGCVVIDSMSHEHEGEGGYLELHEKELERMAGSDWAKRNRMTFAAWIKPAGLRRKLINKILQINCSFVFCFRAKEKLKIVPGKDPQPLGWQAIAGEEFVYEMTSRLLLPPGAAGVPSFDKEAFEHNAAKMQEQHREMFVAGKPLDEETGAKLARWAAGTTAAPRTIAQTTGAGKARSIADGVEVDGLRAQFAACDKLAEEAFLKAAKLSKLEDLPAADVPDALAWLARRKARLGG
jgi:hypothetical protein